MENQKPHAHGPHPAGEKKFVRQASLAAAMAMTPFALYRNSSVYSGRGGEGSRSPETIRDTLTYDVHKYSWNSLPFHFLNCNITYWDDLDFDCFTHSKAPLGG